MFNGIRRLFGPIMGFLMAGGLLTTGWYGFLQAIAAGMLSFLLPAVGLSVMSAAWWFPFARWGYKKYVYPLAPSSLPEPDTLKYALNPPSLIKAAIAVGVWFYTPLVTYSAVRFFWNHLKPTPAPINDEALNFTDRQFQKAENNEELESSHDVPYPLQAVAAKVAEEVKTAKSKAEAVYGAATHAYKQESNKSSASASKDNKKKNDDSNEGDDSNSNEGEKSEKTQTKSDKASSNKQQQQQTEEDDEKEVGEKSSEKNIRSRKQQQSDKNKPAAVADKNKPVENIKPSAPSEVYSQ